MKPCNHKVISTLILLTMSVSAGRCLGQEVTKTFDNTPLPAVLKEIENQTGMSIVYSRNDIKSWMNVTAQFTDAPIEFVMRHILDPQLGFTVTDKMIVIFSKKYLIDKLSTDDHSMNFPNRLTGTVLDENGEPATGASVVVEGTNQGTSTDLSGRFSLIVPDGARLKISYLGHISQIIETANRSELSIRLVEGIQPIDEVVVIGYGTTNIRSLTSSVASISASRLNRGISASIDQMLQGHITGLNMTMDSAQPGAGLTINVRGALSQNGNNEPLYVIDGVPMTTNTANTADFSYGELQVSYGINRSPLNTINPSDIESISVLKDASAAAIYGSASANGVIIITTKRGDTNRPTVSYDGSYTIQVRKPYSHALLTASQWREQRNLWKKEKSLSDNNIFPYGSTDYNNDGVWDIDDYNAYMSTLVNEFSLNEIVSAGKGTDWLDYVTRSGYITQHNVSVRGGTLQTKYFMSYNYYLNKGLLKTSDMIRHSVRANIDQQLGKVFTLALSMSYSNLTNHTASSGSGNIGQGHYNMLQAAYAYTPDVPAAIDPQTGKYYQSYDTKLASPAAYTDLNDESIQDRVFIAPDLTIHLSNNLTLKAVGGFDMQSTRRDMYIPSSAGFYIAPNGLGQVSTLRTINKSVESYFTYDLSSKNHHLNAVLGVGAYQSFSKSMYMQGLGFFTDSFGTDNIAINSDIDKRFIATSRVELTKLSQFGRLNYTFKNRYTLSLTGRNDGSSVFAINKKWGFFPSLSAAWQITEEPFMAATKKYVSDLKLRIGYGTAGNETRTANSLELYSTGSGLTGTFRIRQADGYHLGVVLTEAENPDLTWETNETVNIGIDFGLLGRRFTGSVDYFTRTAHNLLDFKSLPSNNPVTNVIANIGSTQARGVEMQLTLINIDNKNLQWSTTFNLSHTIYRWKQRNPELVLSAWVAENAEMSAVYGWRTDGIFKSYDEIDAYRNAKGELIQPDAVPGNIRYVDVNGDGVMSDKDIVRIGRTTPSITASLSNDIIYKNLDFSFYLYGAFGHIKAMGDRGSTTSLTSDTPGNTYNTISNVWSSNNTSGIWPGIGTDRTASQRTGGVSDFWYTSSNFVKIKNISLGYRLPNSLFGEGKAIKQLRLGIDMQNLATFTGYFGFDPELNGQSPYPQARSFTFSIKALF